MRPLLEDKTALVTGAASGIGRATALLFAAEGAMLMLADIDEEGGRETAQLVGERGAQAFFVRCDVSVSEDVEAAVETAVEQFGRLDCAFNNAGIEGSNAPIGSTTQRRGAASSPSTRPGCSSA